MLARIIILDPKKNIIKPSVSEAYYVVIFFVKRSDLTESNVIDHQQ